MANWEALVRCQLTDLGLETDERNEVISEIATHLEETCEELRRQGMTEEEAARRALSQVENWQKLGRLIQIARKKENNMTNRVKQFWLPSLLTMFLSMGLLMLIQLFGPSPLKVAMKSGWSVIAPTAVIYLPWLFSLPVIGAMGAYLSNRAGGSKRAMLSSVVFPVLPYTVFFFLALPAIAIFYDRLGHNFMFLALFVGLLAWVVAPAAALLTGGVLVQHFVSRRLEPGRIAGS
jgi:hypothetical protein